MVKMKTITSWIWVCPNVESGGVSVTDNGGVCGVLLQHRRRELTWSTCNVETIPSVHLWGHSVQEDTLKGNPAIAAACFKTPHESSTRVRLTAKFLRSHDSSSISSADTSLSRRGSARRVSIDVGVICVHAFTSSVAVFWSCSWSLPHLRLSFGSARLHENIHKRRTKHINEVQYATPRLTEVSIVRSSDCKLLQSTSSHGIRRRARATRVLRAPEAHWQVQEYEHMHILISGVFNAQVGTNDETEAIDSKYIGRHALREQNSRDQHQLTLVNTFVQKQDHDKVTYRTTKQCKQLDYVLMSRTLFWHCRNCRDAEATDRSTWTAITKQW